MAGEGEEVTGAEVHLCYNTMGARPCGLAPIVLYIAPAVE